MCSVRREDLYDSASDHGSSPEPETAETAELRAKLNARLSSLLSLDLPPLSQPSPLKSEPTPTTSTNNEPPASPPSDSDLEPQPAGSAEPEPEEAEPEFAFRLFSTSTPSQKVVLLPDNDADPFSATGKPYTGPAITPRALSHHIRGELSELEQSQFAFAAVSGAEVLKRAREERAWGLEVPWRVTSIKLLVSHGRLEGAGTGTGGDGKLAEDGSKKKKTRPGKKRRIVLRKRDKAKKEKEAVVEKAKMSKEEHLKEKKKRLNREKKLKRRAKEKEKKLAAKGEVGAGGEGEGQGSEGGFDEE